MKPIYDFLEGKIDTLPADVSSLPVEVKLIGIEFILNLDGDEDEADRLIFARFRAGVSGKGDGEVTVEEERGADRHLFAGLERDGTIGADGLFQDTEAFFDSIRIGDRGAFEDLACTGQGGEGGSKHPAGERFHR